MWEATLIESKGSGNSWKQWWSMPAAAAVHTALILGALLVSYWQVEAVEAPPQTVRYIEPIQVSLTPPPALGGGERRASSASDKRSTPPVTQPTDVPPLSKDSEIALDSFEPSENEGPLTGIDAPSGPGIPSGVPGGIGTTPSSNGIRVEDPDAVEITPNVTPPVLLRRVEPEYPLVAAHARIHGMVIFEAVITKNGDVEDVRTLRSDHPSLEKAAKEAVLGWKYKPALVNGRPVKVYFTVTCRFHFR